MTTMIRWVVGVVSILLLLAAAYGFAAVGPTSFQAQWRDLATRALAEVSPVPGFVSEADLAAFPSPSQRTFAGPEWSGGRG